MKIPFIKMQAQGNDFIILENDKIDLDFEKQSHLAIDICDRHYGIGADGLVLLIKAKQIMIIYNADGSRAEMCGSALRCCCALLAQQSGKKEISIKTDSGKLNGIIDNENPSFVTVEIGKPQMIKKAVKLDGYQGDYIKIGNPHFVIFHSDLKSNPHLLSGQALSGNSFFKNGANIEFVKIISKEEIELVVWERGVGATLACGTGSAAAVFSGHYNNLLVDFVKVQLPGGIVYIHKMVDTYFLGGETALVGSGIFEWKI